MRRWYVIAAPYIWLLLFFLIPFFIVFKISLSDSTRAIPPYIPTLDITGGWEAIKTYVSQLDFENYAFIFSDPLYINAYWSSIKIAGISTFLTLLIGYPIAYGMARAPHEWRPTLMMLVILPFWTSFLIRVYAWIGILKKEGLLNLFLMNMGVISEPLTIMNTNIAVYIGIVYSYLPFMILPLYSSLEKISPSLIEAAEDLGSPPWRAFWQITFPLSLAGVFAGCLLVFIPAVGEFVIPDLLGGSETLMIGKLCGPSSSITAIGLLHRLSRWFYSSCLSSRSCSSSVCRPMSGRLRDEHSFFLVQCNVDRTWLCLSLHSHSFVGDLFLQRVTTGDGVGWLVDQMVREPADKRGPA